MFKVELKGINGVKAQFAAATDEIKAIVSQEVEGMAKDWVKGAYRDAPVDQSSLKSSISYYMDGDFSAVIVSGAFYSAFMEFGTKGKYQPIPGTEAIAEQFKNYKGGDIKEMKKAIERWVKRKGIHLEGLQQAFGKEQEQFLSLTERNKARKSRGLKRITQKAALETVVFLIVRSILKNGISPHPYFFKQQDITWPTMIKRIESRLVKATGVKVFQVGALGRPKIITV